MDTAYLNTASNSSATSNFAPKQQDNNYASVLTWPQYVNTAVTQSPEKASAQQQQSNLMNSTGSAELDMSSIVDQTLWSIEPTQQEQVSTDLSLNNLFTTWTSDVQVPPIIKEEWTLDMDLLTSQQQQQQQQQILDFMPFQEEPQSLMLPLTPPNLSPTKDTFVTNNSNNNNNGLNSQHQKEFSTFMNTYQKQLSQQRQRKSREVTPPPTISTSVSGSNSPTSSVSTPPSMSYYLPLQMPLMYQQNQSNIGTSTSTPTRFNNINNATSFTPKPQQHRGPGRRKSSSDGTPTRTYRRRASSHLSVASVVSLSAHEPVAHTIDGIEHITFLYSHDRLVKEYTVRTDVDSVPLQDIPLAFRVQNAIYPRANVSREEYDGNRWEYETSCNKLGWELCWLNQEQLCGRRGLIQRAVDSYRNRHAEMRSRRVTRQEKVANGTLRKRRAKKALSAIL